MTTIKRIIVGLGIVVILGALAGVAAGTLRTLGYATAGTVIQLAVLVLIAVLVSYFWRRSPERSD